ncbi:brain-specific angiogenesis inhibitor 1-associated protein 2-like isoform X2 [Argiope bruennichi]|uniref:brain-specific angiogenesis inhibitor 1-associated protein 2-like isoform X2 n=1 Tax=Argiope bruennichi TaxID=94029 RepID=UPI002494397E|nr:brain-specific angiogenesis inhibitor 1-associated protein 2-like isoform X2 [Argiope bruennichi]
MLDMDADEIAKLVDGAYKNILEKFNPCARQLISAGKAYLKSLHGAVASSKTYLESISKLARHAHQATWGGSTDIGTALMQLVEVHKEIHAQQTNILKAFYVDLLLPLESNLEKDTKVVAGEHKRFLQQHKSHHDSYQKALSMCKKQKKRTRSSLLTIGKDVKQLHAMEDEKKKLDGFCDQSLKQGQSLLQHNLEQWLEIVKTRERLPESIEKMFEDSNTSKIGSEYASSSIVISPMSCQNMSCNTSPTIGGMRKTQSIDSSYLDLRDYEDAPYPRPLSRAKSDFNLTSSSASLVSSDYSSSLRAKTMASVDGKSNSSYHVRALYSYLSSGEHQLSFHEGDVIVLIGERNKGWQYGENLRNHRVGWFPIAYTEPILDSSESEEQSSGSPERSHWGDNSRTHLGIGGSPLSRTPRRPSSSYTLSSHALPPEPPINHTSARPHSTFTDSPLFSTKDIGSKATPVKTKQTPRTPLHDANHQTVAPIASSTTVTYASIKFHHPPLQELQETPQIFRSPRRSLTAPFPISVPPPNPPSLHSSNDSGFCNEASPTPCSQIEGATVEEGAADKESRDNMFAGVKLRKVVTNDRSAPMIS